MTSHDVVPQVQPHLPLGAGAEFDVIRALLDVWGPWASGIGDDAAVLDVPAGEQLVVSTDASVENVHFRRDWLSAQEIGARAATAALSDLAAMAARPLGLLLALGVPERWDHDIAELARGVGESAEEAGCPIVGGNITRADALSLTLTALGSARQPLRRRGAQVGDLVYVTGRLGGPGAALRALLAGRTPRPADMHRFIRPQARLAEGQWFAGAKATAAIDISDGLAADAAHLARASGAFLELDATLVPIVDGVSVSEAIASGEEYELLVTVPAEVSVDVPEFEELFGIPLTRIGVVRGIGSEPVRIIGARVDPARGHDHLS